MLERGIQILTIVGLIDAAVLAIGIGYAVYLWWRGTAPVLIRLGNGLARHRIAIFANDNLASLKGLLLDSRLFRERNICDITGPRDIERADGANVYVICWPDWSNDIAAVLGRTEKCALVVYAPADAPRIPAEIMRQLDNRRHMAVANFRGRVLNDVITSMITLAL